jgi:hypothetical protein
MAAEREGKLVSAPASRVGDWLGVSTRRSDAVQSPQRAQKKKSALGIGVGSGTLGARAALIALKKGAYLRRARTSWTVSIIMEDDGHHQVY